MDRQTSTSSQPAHQECYFSVGSSPGRRACCQVQSHQIVIENNDGVYVLNMLSKNLVVKRWKGTIRYTDPAQRLAVQMRTHDCLPVEERKYVFQIPYQSIVLGHYYLGQ